MPPEEIDFQTFFAAKMKDRGVSIKKLSEETGIAPTHIVNMMYGRYDDLPAAPYVRGYLTRLGDALDFDGDVWWERLKKERLVQNSGEADTLPGNRFIKQSPAKLIWISAIALIIIIYLAFQIPVILGKPALTITIPAQSPFTTTSSTFTFSGIARGANSLSLNGDSVAVAQDGSWQKTVLLENGPNSFQLAAKKLLGGETDVTEQIFYDAPAVTPTPANASSSPASTTPNQASST